MTIQKIHCQKALLPGGWKQNVLLELNAEGYFQAISTGIPETETGTRLGLVVPGMPNLHSHGFQRLIAGLTGSSDQATDSFWGWREAMYRVANQITPEQLESCMSRVFAEMLASGYTSCAEFHYLHHPPGGGVYAQRAEMSLRVIAAAERTGMALTLLPVLYCASGFGQHSVQAQQSRFNNSLDEYMLLVSECERVVAGNTLHQVGLAPHSLRAVPADVLSHLFAGFDASRYPIHIHIAEQPAEVTDCMAFLGQRPVEWLLDHFQVNENWCLVHATHMSPEERERAAGSNAIAGLCPSTEADLGDGFFETVPWLRSGGRFGIGTDSNLRISPSEELRLLEFTERLRSGRRNVLVDDLGRCGQFLYTHAANSGASALGQNTGELTCGHRADLVELDADHPMLSGRDGSAIMDSFVFAGGNEMVRSVWVAGKQVVKDGQHLQSEALKKSFTQIAKDLLKT